MRRVAFAKGEALSHGQRWKNGMAHDAEMTGIPPSTEPAAPSAAAKRMRRYRQRRRDGLRCLMIELRETEIDTLIRNGLLAAESRHDYESVQSALYAFLDRALGKLG
jgi:hypothetical protein